MRKLRLIPKFLMSQTGKQTFTLHLFSNVSGRKVNQTMEYGQLIEYKVRNVFLEKWCKKCARKTSSRLVAVLFVFFL